MFKGSLLSALKQTLKTTLVATGTFATLKAGLAIYRHESVFTPSFIYSTATFLILAFVATLIFCLWKTPR